LFLVSREKGLAPFAGKRKEGLLFFSLWGRRRTSSLPGERANLVSFAGKKQPPSPKEKHLPFFPSKGRKEILFFFHYEFFFFFLKLLPHPLTFFSATILFFFSPRQMQKGPIPSFFFFPPTPTGWITPLFFSPGDSFPYQSPNARHPPFFFSPSSAIRHRKNAFLLFLVSPSHRAPREFHLSRESRKYFSRLLF